MATNKRDLKAYVRYDGNQRVIPGSLVLRRAKPKVGNWKEIQTYECCDGGGACTAPVVLTAPLYGTTNRETGIDAPAILCDGQYIMNFGFLGSAPNDSWVNIIDDANETLSWIGTWELGEDQIILNMDCNFYTFLQTLCAGEITLFATSV